MCLKNSSGDEINLKRPKAEKNLSLKMRWNVQKWVEIMKKARRRQENLGFWKCLKKMSGKKCLYLLLIFRESRGREPKNELHAA